MGTTKTRKSSSKKFLDFGILIPAIIIFAVYANLKNLQIPALAPAETKPFSFFEEFYPYYISQHVDDICRRLHFIGTSLVVLYSLIEPAVGPSLVLAGLLGNIVFVYTRHIEHGIVEMALMLLTFLYFMTRWTGNWKKAMLIPIIAYTFAWVGHFVFEQNRPATFIYPTYSLMGDFNMWWEIATQQRAF